MDDVPAEARAASVKEAEATRAPLPQPPYRSLGAIRRLARSARAVLVVVLGIVLPIVLLFLAYQAIGRLDEQVTAGADLAATTKSLPAPIAMFSSANDYAFLTVAFLEAGNQRVMLNKHRMKIAVIHIGFAVSCVGLLLMVLGVDAGGIEASGSAKELASVNLKVTSSGVAVFVLGAAMAAAGGLLPNKYATVGVPGFALKTPAAEQASKKQLDEWLVACEKDSPSLEDMRACIGAVRGMVQAAKE